MVKYTPQVHFTVALASEFSGGGGGGDGEGGECLFVEALLSPGGAQHALAALLDGAPQSNMHSKYEGNQIDYTE